VLLLRKYQALYDVDMDIHDRQITAFIGPSGCGKSTLLRTLNRIYELYPGQRATGKIMIAAATCSSARTTSTCCGQGGNGVQKATLPMSVQDTSASGVHLYERLSRSDMEARVQWALEKAALWTSEGQAAPGWNGSVGRPAAATVHRARRGGEAGRAAARRAASALDPISTQKIEQLITELKKDYTIVIVTHNMQQAARVSDYTAFMYLGRLVEFGDTNKLFTKPDQTADRGIHHREVRMSLRQHTSQEFEMELESVRQRIFDMGRHVDQVLESAGKALLEQRQRTRQSNHRRDQETDSMDWRSTISVCRSWRAGSRWLATCGC